MKATITIVNDKSRKTFLWDLTNEKGIMLKAGHGKSYLDAFLQGNDAAKQFKAKKVEVDYTQY